MNPDGPVLIASCEIQDRVAALGAQISHDYRGEIPVLVGILRGATVFLADLVRAVTIPVALDFMTVQSYGASTTSSRNVQVVQDVNLPLKGRHVILVEDIVDTGHTLSRLIADVGSREPKSMRICTLLDKKDNREIDVPVHYIGFTIPSVFVVGYGLDYDQAFRNLPHIVALEPVATDRE